MSDPTPCHACPEAAGPSGWCATHRNRLNAIVGSKIMKEAPLSDLIAVAQHPGWRGRKARLMVEKIGDRPMWYVGSGIIWRGFDTAPEALAALDRCNGVPSESEVARLKSELAACDADARVLAAERHAALRALDDINQIAADLLLALFPSSNPPATTEARAVATVRALVRVRDELLDERDAARKELAEVEREATDQRHRAEAAEDALTDLSAIVRGEADDPWPDGEPKPNTIAGRAYDAVCQVVRERDDARKRSGESATNYRLASETADYMRERLLPALDAAGVRYDDPPEALRLWIVRQEEAIDRQSSDLATASAEADILRRDIEDLRGTLAAVRKDRDVYMSERDEARRALTDARSIAAGLLPAPPPSAEPPATLGESTVATVAALRRSEEKVRRLLREMDVALVAARAEASDLRVSLARSQEYATTLGETLRADLAAARSDADTLRARLDRYRAAVAALAVAVVLAVVAAVGGGS